MNVSIVDGEIEIEHIDFLHATYIYLGKEEYYKIKKTAKELGWED